MTDKPPILDDAGGFILRKEVIASITFPDDPSLGHTARYRKIGPIGVSTYLGRNGKRIRFEFRWHGWSRRAVLVLHHERKPQ